MSEYPGDNMPPDMGEASEPTGGDSIVVRIEHGEAHFPYNEQHLTIFQTALRAAGVEVTIDNRDLPAEPFRVPVPEKLVLPLLSRQDFMDTAVAAGLEDSEARKLTTRAYHALIRARHRPGGPPVYTYDEDITELLDVLVTEQREIVPEVLEALVLRRRILAVRSVGEQLEGFYAAVVARHKELSGGQTDPAEDTSGQ